MKNLYFLIVLLFLFLGCSSNVFEPKLVTGKRALTAEYDKDIRMQHLQGITYSDGKVVTMDGEIANVTLDKAYAYINDTKTHLIAADNGGGVLLIDKTSATKKKITFAHRVLSANYQDDLLAVVTVKNSMQLFDVANDALLFKFASSEVLAADIRLANPVFNQGLIFFPSLDGKVQIYSKEQQKMIRTMSISTEDKFNNVIFFRVMSKKIIAATGTALYLFGKEIVKKELPIRTVLANKQGLLVVGKDGTITRYSLELEAKNSLKLKFAHIVGTVETPLNIYMLESEGYMIKVNKDLTVHQVYLFDVDEQKIFAGVDRFYLSDGYFLPH